jgi:ABC-type transport system involved in multi-copper enzyme maturation permease subunit
MTAAAAAVPLPRAPDALDRLGAWIGERINPIVVKEVRQGLRTRAFWIFFSLLLIFCIIISLVAAATGDDWPDRGKAYFMAYDVCLGLVQFFVIPYSAYRSMAREREEETWVLLTLTGLGPRRILRGKMGSFMLQGVLYASAAAPFLLFSYYLNGIDLPTIVGVVVAGIVWQLLLTSLSVSLATLASSKLMHAVMHFVALGMLLLGTWMGLVATVGAVERLRYIWTDPSARIVVIGVLFLLASWGILLYEAAAARLSLVTESYARGPRLVLVLQIVGMVALFVWAAVERPYAELLAVGSIVCSAHLLLVGIVVASDHDGMARALWLKSSRASLFEPGALRGFRLVVLLYGAIALAFVAAQGWMHAPSLFSVALAAPAYGVIYLTTAIIFGRLGRVDSYHRPRITRVAALGLTVVGAGGPPLAAALAGRDPGGILLNCLNPIMGLVNLFGEHGDRVPHVMGLWAIALGLVLVAQEMLARRDGPHTGSR